LRLRRQNFDIFDWSNLVVCDNFFDLYFFWLSNRSFQALICDYFGLRDINVGSTKRASRFSPLTLVMLDPLVIALFMEEMLGVAS
jgi:hypothetical protein